MIRRRKDLPILDPKKLRLPKQPRVVELHVQPYEEPSGDESLSIYVVVDALLPEQRKDFAWTIPVRRAIVRELERLDDDRLPVLFIRLKSEWKGRE